VLKRELDKDRLSRSEDWVGNNIALACPVCSKVFIVSGLIHKKGRSCPECKKATAYVSPDGTTASVECKEGALPEWKSA
jgi:hypothetical protein